RRGGECSARADGHAGTRRRLGCLGGLVLPHVGDDDLGGKGGGNQEGQKGQGRESHAGGSRREQVMEFHRASAPCGVLGAWAEPPGGGEASGGGEVSFGWSSAGETAASECPGEMVTVLAASMTPGSGRGDM